MRLVTLGTSGLTVPGVVLGTATFGLQCDEEVSRRILDRAREYGMTWLDTSSSYPLGSGPQQVGVTEALLGRWIGSRREDVLIATKVYNRTGPQPWALGLSRKHLLSAVDGSLRRLQTDHIDLLQLHRWDRKTPIEETLSALDSLVQSGKVRYVGCCNVLAYQLAQMLSLAEARRVPRMQSVQVRYSAVMRGAEFETLRLCQEQTVAALAFNILAGGMLSGKYDRAQQPDATSRFSIGEAGDRYKRRYWSDSTFETVDELRRLAEASGVELPVLAMAWVVNQPGITAPIIGVSRPEQLDTVVKALGWLVPIDLMEAINAATLRHRVNVEELDFESS